MFPTDSKIVAGFLGIGLGALGSGAILLWGDPANSLHVQGLGWCMIAAIGSIGAIIGANILQHRTP